MRLRRVVAWAVSRLPASVLRRLGRAQFASPLLRRVVLAVAAPSRSTDVTIAHGAGKGLRFNSSGANAGYALGTTEPEIQDLLSAEISSGDVVWDVGANVGFFTVIAARRVGERGRVVAFEPLPESCAAIRRNVSLNRFEEIVAVREVAVARATGRRRLFLAEESTWARLDSGRHGVQGSVEVAAVALDDEPPPLPDLVKIDVEGAEVEVLEGMSRVLEEKRPRLVIEMHGRNREIAALLRGAGYRWRVVGSDADLEEAPWWVHVAAEPDGP